MACCTDTGVTTFFAPAGRETPEGIRRQRALVADAVELQAAIDAMPEAVLVLNTKRQVVAANEALLGRVGTGVDQIIGKRPGETIGCANCKLGPDGCGTAKHCTACGAVRAILDSQRGVRATEECRLLLETTSGSRAMDLKVTATRMEIFREPLTICAVSDISSQKRLAVFTRMFFHDVMNTAGTMRGLVEVLLESCTGDDDDEELLQSAARLAERLVEELESQRDLTYAEAGDLAVQWESFGTKGLLEDLRAWYSTHEVAAYRRIELRNIWDGQIVSDRRLLTRVLGNMIKNALEATEPGGAVEARCTREDDRVTFSVHNHGVMPEEVQLQVFQRSFSTKSAAGRGIGTHSMKLFGEHYLGGKVDFRSTEPEGTVFTISLPVSRPPERSAT